jgi:N-acetyl sugar amidotransferase
MRYCKKCIQPDTRPNIYFNEEGVCGACLYQEEIEGKINWAEREKEIQKIAQWAKEKAKENNCNYDCAIGVSGGKDSTFQALYARDKLNLHPLLVNSEPEGISEIGRKNIENLKNLGFDVVSIRPNPVVMKQLIKRDFYKYVNPVKITEFSLWASTYRMAHVYKIPLIIQGENDCLTLGVRNKQGIGDDALLITEQDTLASGWQDYLGEDGIDERDLFFFHFDSEQMRKDGIRAIWLQYYVKEWSPSHNAEFSIAQGLTIRPEYSNPKDRGTYCNYFQLDAEHLVTVNQMIKYIKFGFGECTDHACYDIRDKKITREEAIELVKRYDGQCSIVYIKKFCDYIGITIEEFWRVVDSVRGPMWEKDSEGKWRLKDPIWEQNK